MRRFLILSLLCVAGIARAQGSSGACDPLLGPGARQATRTFGDLQVCLVAANGSGLDDGFPSDWVARATTVMLETRRPGDVRRYLLDPSRLSWTVNGRSQPIDSLAEHWQRAVVTLVDLSYEAEAIRSQSATLAREIDSLPARGAAATAQIDRLDRAIQGVDVEVMDIRRHATELRDAVTNLERQRSTDERRVNNENMKAAAATDARARQAAEAAVRNAETALRLTENRLRDVERQRDDYDAERMVADIQERRDILVASRKLALLRLDLANADAKTFSRELSQLDAAQRLAALDARVETARQALVAILEARGKAASK